MVPKIITPRLLEYTTPVSSASHHITSILAVLSTLHTTSMLQKLRTPVLRHSGIDYKASGVIFHRARLRVARRQ